MKEGHFTPGPSAHELAAEFAGITPVKTPLPIKVESRFLQESKALPVHIVGMAENTTIRSPRQQKEFVARQALGTLEAAVRAGDWKSAQASADLISQISRWLQLSDEQIEQS